MLNKNGFNLWAEDYDKTVQLSEEKNEYPFAGYKTILNNIYNEIMQHNHAALLDIGIGTGVLSSKLYDHQHIITGMDFSSKMIEIARNKMPNANLFEWDINNGIPNNLEGNSFDFIVSTYTLHHLTDTEKVAFLIQLAPLLKLNGKIIIGDISFETMDQLKQCQQQNSSHWDDSEFYFVHDSIYSLLSPHFDVQYEQISVCGGIYILSLK